jgi:hypothetical protein
MFFLFITSVLLLPSRFLHISSYPLAIGYTLDRRPTHHSCFFIFLSLIEPLSHIQDPQYIAASLGTRWSESVYTTSLTGKTNLASFSSLSSNLSLTSMIHDTWLPAWAHGDPNPFIRLYWQVRLILHHFPFSSDLSLTPMIHNILLSAWAHGDPNPFIWLHWQVRLTLRFYAYCLHYCP